MSSCGCGCGGVPKLIFACSGAADVGQISDLATRKMAAEGTGKMFCLAGIGGRVPGIMETTRAVEKILAIDGCPLDCTRRTLLEAGFERFEHLRITDLGLEKGQSPATPENVQRVATAGTEKLTV